MSGTRFAPGKDAELAWVDGQIQLSPGGTDTIPILDVFHNKQVMNLLKLCGTNFWKKITIDFFSNFLYMHVQLCTLDKNALTKGFLTHTGC